MTVSQREGREIMLSITALQSELRGVRSGGRLRREGAGQLVWSVLVRARNFGLGCARGRRPCSGRWS